MLERSTSIRPGSTIGILGGGQLGRMMALAAASLGLRSHIFCPDKEAPAYEVAAAKTVAAYDDEAALAAFADAVDVVTYEFENVPAPTASFLAGRVALRPNAAALETAQDRLVEKSYVAGLGIGTAPFRAVDGEQDLVEALEALGAPAILKTRRFGYDGKGQVRIRPGDRAGEAFAHLGGAPSILEGFVPFTKEISIVAARGTDGSFAAYDPCLNEHRAGILHRTTLPSGISDTLAQKAILAARRIAEALDYVGVIAVEMFVVEGESGEDVLVNEIAPRVHNSGHWTTEGAETSQFEQHIRAVCGWPLGATTTRGAVEMTNLIGDEIETWPAILAEPGAHLHHYGKTKARPGRKMGHVTRVRPHDS
jgi:5-(carboxyamino)imidazole ribonucleotide synthase